MIQKRQKKRRDYLYIFGNTPELSSIELESIYPVKQIRYVHFGAILRNTVIDPQEAMHILGGVVKIAEIKKQVANFQCQDVVGVVCSTITSKRPVLGISMYQDIGIRPEQILREVKQALKTEGIAVRYVLPKSDTHLSSVVVNKQKVLDIIICKHKGEYILATTSVVQSFESWGMRDYRRPKRDIRRGMLPPKIARMMVNIALGKESEQKTVFDPFCGMGTVLQEAVFRNVKVIGSDLNKDAVVSAKQNLAWLAKITNKTFTYQVFQSDAAHVSRIIEKNSIDAIVTEPFMGSVKLGDVATQDTFSGEKIRNIIKGLEKLYIGCLREWHPLLTRNGCIVIILPSITWRKNEYFVKKVVDSCEKLGYSNRRGPIDYNRPHARVKRHIYIFDKI